MNTRLGHDHIRSCLYDETSGPEVTYLEIVDWVANEVEEMRGLEYEQPTTELLSPEGFDELLDRPAEVGQERSEEFTTRWLAWGLGFTPHGIDVNTFLQGTGSELIAGFYDPRREKVVVKSDGTLDGNEQVILAHEYTHAATDQAFGFRNRSPHVIDDRALADASVVEGDASLLELRFISRIADEDALRKVIEPRLSYKDDFREQRRGGVPHIMIDRFVLPYQWGLAFVCSVFKERGWKGVNSLYGKKGPRTTAEVMFPQRFLRGEQPATAAPLSPLEEPWEREMRATIGAAHLKALFEAPGDVGKRSLPKPLERAAAWNGGSYELWVDGSETDTLRNSAIGVSLVERKGSRGVLCRSLHLWYRRSFLGTEAEQVVDLMHYSNEHQQAVLSCKGRDVRLAIAPTVEVARALLEEG